MKPVQFSEDASAELVAAIRWYEVRRAGLGGELYDAVNRTVALIETHPDIGTLRTRRPPSRQLAVPRFPYKVVYRVRDDGVYVVALAHASRRPGYWKHR